MLARACEDCSHKRDCARRFVNAKKGDFVYCPDGSQYLIDIEEI